MKKPSDTNILLINPWITDFKAYDFWLKPQGLLHISSLLKRYGYNVSFIDCMDRNHPSVIEQKKSGPDMTGKFACEEIEKPEIYKNIKRSYKRYGIQVETFIKDLNSIPEPDMIMVTCTMTYWYPSAHLAISLLKEKFPHVPVILGGIYATLCHDFAIKHSGAHMVYKGSDENEILNIVQNYTKTKIAAPMEKEYFSLDFSLYEKLDYGGVLTSVGCPYNCTYCASKLLQPLFLTRKPEDTLKEIKFLSKRVSHIAFLDEALLINSKENILPLLNSISEEDLRLKLYAPNGLHAKFMDKNISEAMKKSGIQIVNLSLETADKEMQKSTGNKVTNMDLEKAVENLFSSGFTPAQIRVYTMKGIPGQTFEEIDKTIDYIFSLGVQNRMSHYSPVPGTKDYEKIKTDYGEDFSEPLYHNNTYHYYMGKWLNMEEKKYLKDKASRANKEIRDRKN